MNWTLATDPLRVCRNSDAPCSLLHGSDELMQTWKVSPSDWSNTRLMENSSEFESVNPARVKCRSESSMSLSIRVDRESVEFAGSSSSECWTEVQISEVQTSDTSFAMITARFYWQLRV